MYMYNIYQVFCDKILNKKNAYPTNNPKPALIL